MIVHFVVLAYGFEMDSDGIQAVDLVTYAGTTDKTYTVMWDLNEPLPDFFVVSLYSVQREEEAIITPGGGVSENEYTFKLPRSGHYIAKISACLNPET